jgi:hypothetical protein
MGRQLDAMAAGYRAVDLNWAAGGDEVFGQLVAARIIGPTSKDSARLLTG